MTERSRDDSAGSGLQGATLVDRGASFTVWAPCRKAVSVIVDGCGEFPLAPTRDGYFTVHVPGAAAGDLYRFRLDDDARLYPDPASRFQPEGPHGPSELIDPGSYRWTDAAWRGVTLPGQIVYEMHVGTFTTEGTWAAAAARLPHLVDLGVTVLEVMPVADFTGGFGWGYDGVDLFAPTRLYGRPDDMRAFVDAAHAHGLAVILDVVYNHLGPDGNFLPCFSPHYFSTRHVTEWGEAINFDGQGSREVRRFYCANAAYWIDEYHLDGLRLDATQSIFDDGERHVLADLCAAARAAAGGRDIVIVGENEPQDTRLVRAPADGGYGLDAVWNDDLHHSAMVAVTGRAEAYYEDHAGAPQEFVSAAKHGYLFQGQFYGHQGKSRGTPGLDLAPAAFVTFTQNHDQVANSDSGLRFHLLGHPGQVRALTAYLLLAPGTPMLFQGQEWGASTPFFYFADHGPELARLVRTGRVEFMTQFASVAADAGLRAGFPDPDAPETFARSKLDWNERDGVVHAAAFALHRDLIRLRRRDPVFSHVRPEVDGAVLSEAAFCLRVSAGGEARLLLVNLGRDLVRRSIPEPLLAPPSGAKWRAAWSSEDSRYGGHGTPLVQGADGWRLPAHSAILLDPRTA